MRTFLLVLALLFGADPPPAAPAAPAVPAPAPPVEAAPAPAPAPTGDEVLAQAIAALTAGDYGGALALSFPAISTFPELAASFRAVADIATDQIERRRLIDAQPIVDKQEAAEFAAGEAAGYTPPAGYAPPPYPGAYPRYERPYRREGNRINLLWGFDAGFPTGLRLEWKIARSAVDSVGLRVGGNTLFYGRLYAVADVTAFMDFKLSEKWQIEAVAGTVAYYGWLYPQAGVAAQYDPPSPIFVNAGARLSLYGSAMPDVGVGFVW